MRFKGTNASFIFTRNTPLAVNLTLFSLPHRFHTEIFDDSRVRRLRRGRRSSRFQTRGAESRGDAAQRKAQAERRIEAKSEFNLFTGSLIHPWVMTYKWAIQLSTILSVTDTQLCKRLCPSDGRSVCWSVRPLVGPSFGRSVCSSVYDDRVD